jgi:hypothetical protein
VRPYLELKVGGHEVTKSESEVANVCQIHTLGPKTPYAHRERVRCCGTSTVGSTSDIRDDVESVPTTRITVSELQGTKSTSCKQGSNGCGMVVLGVHHVCGVILGMSRLQHGVKSPFLGSATN